MESTTKGLDIDTMTILLARQRDDETVFVQQRNSFVELAYSEIDEQIFSRSEILPIRKDNPGYVVGDDAWNCRTTRDE